MTVTRSTKLICFRGKRQESFKRSGISSPLIDTLGRLKIHIALSNQANIDVSSVTVTVLPWLFYPYFALNVKLNKMKYADPC